MIEPGEDFPDGWISQSLAEQVIEPGKSVGGRLRRREEKAEIIVSVFLARED
jgi:hypothetical protein